MSQFGLKITLPPPGASDVTTRELSVSTNGAEPVVTTYPGTALETAEMIFNADDTLSAVLSDIDGHHNRSQPSAPFTYTVTDDVPPPAPGELGVKDKRQIG